jgi:hypothetical protein
MRRVLIVTLVLIFYRLYDDGETVCEAMKATKASNVVRIPEGFRHVTHTYFKHLQECNNQCIVVECVFFTYILIEIPSEGVPQSLNLTRNVGNAATVLILEGACMSS